mmetsp:Transcript_54153/g.110819  ORF Transcript_54153/g.110819 Transcript_54153/m.110819 type:complete len:118 (-) Transcript_54153:80-433(-)
MMFDPPTKRLSFLELLEAILRLRGGISATVTDVVDVREYVKFRCDSIEKNITDLVQTQLGVVEKQLSRILQAQEEAAAAANQGDTDSDIPGDSDPIYRVGCVGSDEGIFDESQLLMR